jgi:Na+-translocating ferredoxin:NAD+ oxidoreductase RnfC subunit
VFHPQRVVLPLKQHAGPAAIPSVKPGDRVQAGDLIADPAAGALGARIHASVSGVVRAVGNTVVIEGGK